MLKERPSLSVLSSENINIHTSNLYESQLEQVVKYYLISPNISDQSLVSVLADGLEVVKNLALGQEWSVVLIKGIKPIQ
jgi:hypothetical protein